MSKVKHTKAKFKIGQVVAVKGTQEVFRISHNNFQSRWYYWRDSVSGGFDESELRALTKRERGDSI